MDIVYQLRALADRLSPTERRIADACLQDMAFAASATIDQLALRAGVSRSALSRFAKTVGCNDIRDLRMQLAQAGAVGARFLQDDGPLSGISRDSRESRDLRNGSGIRDVRDTGDGRDTLSTVAARFESIVGDIEVTLRRHLQGFDDARFQAAVVLLAEASMIYAYGMGGTSTIASSELQHRLVRLGRPIAAYHDPVLMRVAGAALGAGHVLVVLSLTGITPELLDATRLAKSYGARVIAITPETSPLSALSDVTLPLVVAETDFIYKPTAARYGMLLAIDLLATELALFVPEDNKERLRRVKLALDAYRQGGERLPLGD